MVLKVTKILAFQVRYAHRKSFMWRFQVGSDVTYWVFGCLYLLLIYFGRVWVVYTLQENSFGGIMGIPTTAVWNLTWKALTQLSFLARYSYIVYGLRSSFVYRGNQILRVRLYFFLRATCVRVNIFLRTSLTYESFKFKGNVALDVARILLRPTTELASTDIATHALTALEESSIRSAS